MEPLSQTQMEILHLVKLGLTNEEIAHKLVTMLGTTKWHLSQIFGKLHVRNRTEAVTKARQLKLL